MGDGAGDFELTMSELRCVAQFVFESAEPLLVRFEQLVPDDDRPRAAMTSARTFIEGQRRTRLQRVSSMDAHRAAAVAPTEVARLAAQAAGDAAAAAYWHPIRKGHQVAHILRAAANAANVAEIEAGGNPSAAGLSLQ